MLESPAMCIPQSPFALFFAPNMEPFGSVHRSTSWPLHTEQQLQTAAMVHRQTQPLGTELLQAQTAWAQILGSSSCASWQRYILTHKPKEPTRHRTYWQRCILTHKPKEPVRHRAYWQRYILTHKPKEPAHHKTYWQRCMLSHKRKEPERHRAYWQRYILTHKPQEPVHH
jgi:hypothetical protein